MASLLHPFTNLTLLRETGPMVIERGAGVFVHDSSGKEIGRASCRERVYGLV